MDENLKSKTLLMAVIENDKAEILMRKKPQGSPPYQETWYIFGCEEEVEKDEVETLKKYLKDTPGIETGSLIKIDEDGEVKEDHDGVVKKFIYHSYRTTYKSGDVAVPSGVEKIEWIEKSKLREYDIVPPSVKLFTKLGYYN